MKVLHIVEVPVFDRVEPPYLWSQPHHPVTGYSSKKDAMIPHAYFGTIHEVLICSKGPVSAFMAWEWYLVSVLYLVAKVCHTLHCYGLWGSWIIRSHDRATWASLARHDCECYRLLHTQSLILVYMYVCTSLSHSISLYWSLLACHVTSWQLCANYPTYNSIKEITNVPVVH